MGNNAMIDQLAPTLSDFFCRIGRDPRIGITHIALYAAALKIWSENSFQSPFGINSNKFMQTAKIFSKTTYYRTLRDLDDWGYICYHPSTNKWEESSVTIPMS